MDDPLEDTDVDASGRNSPSEIYRANAATERAAADAATLPNRKAMHERSAEVWEQKAAAAEATVGMKRVNDATKLEQKSGRTAGRDNEVRAR